MLFRSLLTFNINNYLRVSSCWWYFYSFDKQSLNKNTRASEASNARIHCLAVCVLCSSYDIILPLLFEIGRDRMAAHLFYMNELIKEH